MNQSIHHVDCLIMIIQLYFQERVLLLLTDIQNQHLRNLKEPVVFTVAEQQPLKIHCSICNTSILAGSIEKNLHNLRSHIDTRSHKLNVQLIGDDDPFLSMWSVIKKSHPGHFRREKNTIICRYDHTVIKLHADAGDPIARTVTHVKSQKHQQRLKNSLSSASSGKKITSFFKPQE